MSKNKLFLSFFSLFLIMLLFLTCGVSAEEDFWPADSSPLILNEIMPANNADTYKHSIGKGDWVEIRNVSQETVSLASFYLSDDRDDLRKYQLTGRLSAGKLRLIFCDSEGRTDNLPCAPFGLNLDETLYLSDGSMILDAVSLKDTPPNGSVGRIDGKEGFFYFSEPTPESSNNDDGKKIISSPPVSELTQIVRTAQKPLV